MKQHTVERGFSRAAGIYDEVSRLQQRIGIKLSGLIDYGLDSFDILDAGAGTGTFATQVRIKNPNANIFANDISFDMLKLAKSKSCGELLTSQSDMHDLPFKDSVFDAAVSNAAVHWLDNLYQAFCEIHRVLKRGGNFYFTTFGPRTLEELRFSFDKAYSAIRLAKRGHINDFKDRQTLSVLLEEAGFCDISVTAEYEKEYYADAFALLGWLRSVGSTVSKDRPKGLWSKRVFSEAARIYRDNFKNNGGITATFEVFFVSAKKYEKRRIYYSDRYWGR